MPSCPPAHPPVRARDNPFAVDRIEAIDYAPAGWTWDELLAKLAAAGGRGAIIGPHGSGKTTLLETLTRRLAAHRQPALLIRLNRQQRTPTPNQWTALRERADSAVVLIDGAEQLGWRDWRRLLHHTASAPALITTAHDRPRLPVLVRCQADGRILSWIVQHLLGEPALPPPAAATLLNQHGGNMREALRTLYDQWAAHGQVNTPDVR